MSTKRVSGARDGYLHPLRQRGIASRITSENGIGMYWKIFIIFALLTLMRRGSLIAESRFSAKH